MDAKQCAKCQAVLPLAEFDNRPSSPDGKAGFCKNCRRAYQREFVAKRRNAGTLAVSDRMQEARDREFVHWLLSPACLSTIAAHMPGWRLSL